MESLKCSWILRTPIIILILVVFNLCLVAFTLAAPAHHATTAAPPQDTTTPTVHIPSTNENSVIRKPPMFFDPTRPTPLSFIKVIILLPSTIQNDAFLYNIYG